MNDNMLLIGGSLFALVNIITREKYEKFSAKAPLKKKNEEFSFQCEKDDETKKPSDFFDRLNSNQTVLRLKFFGDHMSNRVHYFAPEWTSLEFDSPSRHDSDGLTKTQEQFLNTLEMSQI